jgi:hypothetical protein
MRIAMNLRRRFLCMSLLPCLLLGSVQATDMPATLSAQDMIVAADKVRNPDQPFKATNTITEYINGKAQDSITLSVYAKMDPSTRQYRNLVLYVAPPRDAGKLVLLNGGQMWFYDPDSKASVRLSPQQRLLGQAANGDVVTVNLARDYTAKMVGPETLLDAEHKNRDCWHLTLSASTQEAVYNHIEYWIERDNAYPVKAKYYSDSGRLLKVAYFTRYAQELGATRPDEVIILDGVNTNLVTTMEFSDYRAVDVPDSWFQRDFLPQFKGQ